MNPIERGWTRHKTRRPRPDREQLVELYVQWLKSNSLRAIARQVGISHTSLSEWFTSAFGAQATNPVAMSFHRSLLEDYPNNPQVERFVRGLIGQPTPNQYRSNHSLQMLSNYQVIRETELLDYVTTPSESAWSVIDEDEDLSRYATLRSRLGSKVVK